MKSKLLVVAGIASSLSFSLTACGDDSHEPTVENFTKILSTKFEETGCLAEKVSGLHDFSLPKSLWKGKDFPVYYDQRMAKPKEKPEVLRQAGIFDRKAGSIERERWGKMRTEATWEYTLTEKGKTLLKPGSKDLICVADAEFLGVKSVGKPTVRANRNTVIVEYRYKWSNVREWTKTPNAGVFHKVAVVQDNPGEIVYSDVFVETDKGWEPGPASLMNERPFR